MKIKLLIILSVLTLLSCRAFSQRDERAFADSCVRVASNSYDPDTVKKYADMAYIVAQRLADRNLMYMAANNLGWAYSERRMFDSAIVMYRKQLLLVASDQDQSKAALVYCNLGLCYKNTNSYFEMWDCFRQAADIYTELKDTSRLCWAIRSQGLPYAQLGMSNTAQKHFNDALRLSTMSGDSVETAVTLYHLAECTLMQYIDSVGTNTVDTLLIAKQQLLSVPPVLVDKPADYSSYTGSILNIAKCYIKLATLTSRNDFADSSRVWLDIFINRHYDPKELWHNVETTLLGCEIEVFRGNFAASVRPLERLLKEMPADTLLLQRAEACRMLSLCYNALGDYKKAYENTVMFHELQDKTHDEETMKRLSNFAAQTNIQRIHDQREITKQQNEQHLNEVQLRQRNFYILIGVAFIVLAAVAVVVGMFLYRKRRLNARLKASSARLAQISAQLATQRNAEEEAKSVMIGSVEYASQIQADTIGNAAKVRELFPDSFVYYRPRDIVSGDWYYADIVRDHRILVNADCTGHGIPGALLSMLGVAALKDLFNKLEMATLPILPGEILDNMRILVKKSLNKTTEIVSKADVDDGMDMTILVFPPDGDKMLFGGANQSALFVHNGEVMRLKGDSNPIGNYVREKEHFTTIEKAVATGDAVYVFSDGIQDQLGGKEIRKFSLKKIMQLVVDNHALPMPQQMQIITSALDDWAGEIAQVDDRSMIGVRV